MSYLVLARKWRPKIFSDVVGQEHVVRALTNALGSGRVHHAFLFTGTRGVGKTTIARILAKALNCEEGVSKEPCGKCAACLSVDEGRFVDLIEVDAASRTGVDDTRDLLDNVQYSPSIGRFKVYLIDEVHMLSRQSFNALLKTLEEPPPHVKFLFATTDPQKLPVTVLSRCLQFNLKRLTAQLIADRMSYICDAEKVDYEPVALARISRAAGGSMRDALSLLDQALAYGSERLIDGDVAAMLGSMDRHRIIELFETLVAGEGAELLTLVDRLDELAPDYGSVLNELATAVQRVAVIQIAGRDAVESDESVEEFEDLAARVSAEHLQLYYQIAITSRRDIDLAPEPRLGFEMALLRMLAFQPQGSGVQPDAPAGGKPSRVAAPATKKPASQPERVEAVVAANPEQLEDWPAFVAELALDGAARQLAEHSSLESSSPFDIRLSLERRNEHLLTDKLKSRLAAAVQQHLGSSVNLIFSVREEGGDTAAQRMADDQLEMEKRARDSIQEDPKVQDLVDKFGATVVSDSVRPVSRD